MVVKEEEPVQEGREVSVRLKFKTASHDGVGGVEEEEEEEEARETPSSQDRSSTQHPEIKD